MEITMEEKQTIKQSIRREVRRRIKELSEDRREDIARKIFSRIECSQDFISACCVAFFASMNDEVPTKKYLSRWHNMGKRVVVPRVEGDIMRFYDYSPDRMKVGAFGIEEPTTEEECPAEDIDVIIVPARAFTKGGVRLGRGGGFYDKYMSLQGFRAKKIGIAFGCQIFDELPTDNHDILVDEVVFEY